MTFQKGGLVVLHRAFDPGRRWRISPTHRVTTMFGVPAMFLFMAQHPAFEETDLSSVRVLIVGGAPCPLPVLKTYLSRGVPMQQGYGLTETAPMVSFLAPEFALTKVGSSGRTPLFVEVKLVDSSSGRSSSLGRQGEMLVRGPNVTPGYWGLPEATARRSTTTVGFIPATRAYFDEDGFLTICDRIKDMIITGGENVYPAEVESALMRHPAIAEVAVIGEPDEQWGEKRRRGRRAQAGPIPDDRNVARFRGRVARALQATGPARNRLRAAAQRDRQDPQVPAPPDLRETASRDEQ